VHRVRDHGVAMTDNPGQQLEHGDPVLHQLAPYTRRKGSPTKAEVGRRPEEPRTREQAAGPVAKDHGTQPEQRTQPYGDPSRTAR
jgi:hypothetical protein